MGDHQHAHTHGRGASDPGDNERWSAEFWDARYAEAPALWSGRPNPRLVERAAGLTPGAALDVGCGEGADVIWLAQRGWTVTGIDISGVALDRAAAHVRQAGLADRVRLSRVDLLDDRPGETDRTGETDTGEPEPRAAAYDLVSVQFLHVASSDFAGLYRRLAEAVRPGGSLLVGGHHPDDVRNGLRDFSRADVLFTPEQLTALLDPEEWELAHVGTPTRPTTDQDGAAAVATDTVVHAVRR